MTVWKRVPGEPPRWDGRAHPGAVDRRSRLNKPSLSAAVLGLVVAGTQLWGFQGRSAPKLYDPDPQACQMEMIRTTYRSNLLPWQDQPEVVQQRLRQLQAAMTLDTLRECQSKGLLTPAQVSTLTVELKLMGGPAGAAQSPVRP
jgi:hypothetical protein